MVTSSRSRSIASCAVVFVVEGDLVCAYRQPVLKTVNSTRRWQKLARFFMRSSEPNGTLYKNIFAPRCRPPRFRTRGRQAERCRARSFNSWVPVGSLGSVRVELHDRGSVKGRLLLKVQLRHWRSRDACYPSAL